MDTLKFNEMAQEAFENYNFDDIVIVDKLRDVQQCLEITGKSLHGIGICFGEAFEDNESFKISFHFEIDTSSPKPKVKNAYAYDCRTGNEIGTWS